MNYSYIRPEGQVKYPEQSEGFFFGTYGEGSDDNGDNQRSRGVYWEIIYSASVVKCIKLPRLRHGI